VTEPDITAYQATKNVVNVLSDQGLAGRLRGFILNKVFQNPQFIRAQGTAEFGCQPLGSIAFDLDASRAFFIGDIPEDTTTFYPQVVNCCSELYPDIMGFRPYRVWSDSDFDKVSSIDIEARRGGYVVALCIALIIGVYAVLYKATRSLNTTEASILFIVTSIFGMLGTLSSFRRAIGRVVSIYIRLFLPKSR
jgi:hypothetical protein